MATLGSERVEVVGPGVAEQQGENLNLNASEVAIALPHGTIGL